MISLILALIALAASNNDCGTYIELRGAGIYGDTITHLEVPSTENVKTMVVEAVYKSYTPSSAVKFWTDQEELMVEGTDLPISGSQATGMITQVFRDTFHMAAGMIHLDILDNVAEFYSLAVYVEREIEGVVSNSEGSLWHVYRNEKDPLQIQIPLLPSEEDRNIGLRFGVTELNADARVALFRFMAGTSEVAMELRQWNPDMNESKSFTMQELQFDSVPSHVDWIEMTLISENYGPEGQKGDSYVAGVVLVDTECKTEEDESDETDPGDGEGGGDGSDPGDGEAGDDGSSAAKGQVVGVSQEARPELLLYPNPASEYIFISVSPEWGDVRKAAVYDLMGRSVHLLHARDFILGDPMRVELGGIPQGHYILQLDFEGAVSSVRFQKR